MSELKVYHCNEWHNEYTEFYQKSEADKVIDELKVKLRVQTSNAEDAWKLKDAYHSDYAKAVKELYEKNKEIRHQKYKRCLDKAEICRQEWCTLYYERKKYRENPFLDHLMSRKNRHKEKWLELAEKFKEEK